MTLRLTNSLTRKIEVFEPIVPNEVSIYCCGVTVYDLCHLGHARSYIVWDVLRRFLIQKGYKVTFVQNFTDIDDKILKKAEEENTSIYEVCEKNIKAFFNDMDALGIIRPDHMPRATKSLDGIRTMITQLEKKGAAYSIDGDVYFAVKQYDSYGKLSGRQLKDQLDNASGRLSKDESKKRNPFDFALWKKAKEGEPSFPSPWGNGRPGWHIECSAMVKDELGDTIDIHLGGADLIFPHHENEIAQSETANNKELARFWLHNGMVNVDGQKMSKSLGNFTTIRSLLENGVSPMSLRLFVLQSHYRKPLDFTEKALRASSNGWDVINTALQLGEDKMNNLGWEKLIGGKNSQSINQSIDITDECLSLSDRFMDAMNDDLNTSKAISILFELAKPLKSLSNQIKTDTKINISKSDNQKFLNKWILLKKLSIILGLDKEVNKIPIKKKDFDDPYIINAIKERKEAKIKKDFLKADKIRDNLKNQGIDLIDKKDGSTDWIRSI